MQQIAPQWWETAGTIIRNMTTRMRGLLTAVGISFKDMADKYYHNSNQNGYQDALLHGWLMLKNKRHGRDVIDVSLGTCLC